jgi:hypothetical protein
MEVRKYLSTIAALGGKARAKKLTAKEQTAHGKVAANARWANSTQAERSANARRAVNARWAQVRKEKGEE